MKYSLLTGVGALTLLASSAFSQTPEAKPAAKAAPAKAADGIKPIPPIGVAIPEPLKGELRAACDELDRHVDALGKELAKKPAQLALFPDVLIFRNAVHYALKYNEFYNEKEVAVARSLLRTGMERAKELKEGKASWTSQTGLVPRGYVSKIDGSVQPYGLVIPPTYRPNSPHKFRLDFWCHGRGETLSELAFLDQRTKQPGEFTPANAIVCHLYGRYCCANKLAGEIDLFEAYEDIRKHYPIDERRKVIRGFSMGGAACWQFAVHYPGFWCAAAPGAGFAETPEFLQVYARETVQPTEIEKTLWHQYDCTDYAINLFNLPTVAYSGEKDKQIQAANVMAKALAAEGMTLTHVIGPGTEHKYHPDSKVEINRRIDPIVERGSDPAPANVKFTTWTLRYDRSHWVIINAMEKHWERARVDADVVAANKVRVATKNVTALTLDMPAGYSRLDVIGRPHIEIDGQDLEAPAVGTDRSWTAKLQKTGGKWAVVDAIQFDGLRKLHGLQGPVDDAFMDSFVMVSPSGKPINDKVGAWTTNEMAHAIDHWRRQFRGETPVKADLAIDDATIAASNLILWGDPSSNQVLARIVDKLPIQWTKESIKVGAKEYPADGHVPVLIYPNPLNPKRYVVLNSGFTFREYDYLNNARQVPKLPDWTIFDISVPPSPRAAAGTAAAGFFTDEWKLAAP